MKLSPDIQSVLAGRRRFALVEGDCIDVLRSMPADSIDSVVVDPPYGMSWRGRENKKSGILNDERPFIWWLYDAFRVIKPGGAILCFCQWKGQDDFRTALRLAGFHIASHVIWDRVIPSAMGHTGCTFNPRHDVIWFGTKGRFRFPRGRPASVIPVRSIPVTHRLHLTQKPDELMQHLVASITPRGGSVLDPCAGSGSTGVAALTVGCPFIGVELDPTNAATARRRLAQADGTPTVKAKPARRAYSYQPRASIGIILTEAA